MQARDLPGIYQALLRYMRVEILLEDIGQYYPRDPGAYMFADEFQAPPLFFWACSEAPSVPEAIGCRGYLELAQQRLLPKLVMTSLPFKLGMLVLPRHDGDWRAVAWMPAPAEEEHLMLYVATVSEDATAALVSPDFLHVNYPLVKPLHKVQRLSVNDNTTALDTAELAWVLSQFGEAVSADTTPVVERATRAEQRRAVRAGRHEPPEIRVVTLNPLNLHPSEHAESAAPGREHHHHWQVRGHWRNQPYGQRDHSE